MFFSDEAELRLDDLIKSLHKPSVTTPTKSSSDGSSGASSATSFKQTVSQKKFPQQIVCKKS